VWSTVCSLNFTNGEISRVSGWVSVFSPNDISEFTRPKNVKFGTKVATSMKMMRTLDFQKKFFTAVKFAKKCRNRPNYAEFPEPLARGHHIYAETTYIWRYRASEFSTIC